MSSTFITKNSFAFHIGVSCSPKLFFTFPTSIFFQKSGTFEVQELWLEYTLQKYKDGTSSFVDIYGTGFVVDSSTNVDGSRTIYGYMGDRAMNHSY